jgi:hypothetical protein
MLTAKNLTDMIGQPLKSSQALLSKLPGPEKRQKRTSSISHTYKSYGLSFTEKIDSGKISTIFLYPKSRTSSAYAGEIPHKLGFDMTRDQVRKVMGEPDEEPLDNEDQWDKGKYRFGVKFDDDAKIEFFYLSAL